MSQQDVLAAVELAGKIALKDGLIELNKDGGAVALEVDALSANLGAYGPALGGLLKPFVKQLLDSVIAKI